MFGILSEFSLEWCKNQRNMTKGEQFMCSALSLIHPQRCISFHCASCPSVPQQFILLSLCASTVLPLVPVCLNNSPYCASVPQQFSLLSQCASTIRPLVPVCLKNSPSCPSVPQQSSFLSQCVSTIPPLVPLFLEPNCLWWVHMGISLKERKLKNQRTNKVKNLKK